MVGKNGLQILTFARSLQTGKMSSSSRNGGRQTANAGNVRSRDHPCRSREKNTRCLISLMIYKQSRQELGLYGSAYLRFGEILYQKL